MKTWFSLIPLLGLSILINFVIYLSTDAIAADLTFEARIAFSSDDAEQRANGSVQLTRSGLHFMLDNYDNTVPRAIGMRWTNVQIPSGATITAAYIRFTVATTGSKPTDVTFHGQAADNAPTFTTAIYNITSRPKTNSSVNWLNIPSWTILGESGPAEQTPDLSTIIQEIVNRPGWALGNSIVLIGQTIPNDSNYGPRIPSTFDYQPANAALLHVEYTTNVTPSTSTIPNFKVAFVGDQLINQGSTDVLQLIKNEGAQMLLLLGDLDHEDDPDSWEQQLDSVLGPDFPVFAVIGNHDTSKWTAPNGYLQKLQARLQTLQQTEGSQICTGDLGTKAACNYKGLFFILSGIGTWPEIQKRVATSSDDAEERANGSVQLTRSGLHFMLDNYDNTVPSAIGMRWTNIQVPPGAIITAAWISFTTATTGSNPLDIRFYGQAADSAPTFTTATYNITSRTKTAAYKDWRGVAPWTILGEEGPAQESTNLANIIQEIVNRPGWALGNSMVLIGQAIPNDWNHGPRIASTFNYIASQAANLHIEYYTTNNDYITYINSQLALDNSLWRICAWHKPQGAMEIEGFSDLTGWGVYEECRKGGAFVVTAHDAAYARTYLMSSFQTQSVASTSNTLVLDKGHSFAAVSGLGGAGISPQVLDGNWWASVYASTCLSTSTDCRANADYGALFCTFNVNGQSNEASCYFKDIDGNIIDQFNLTSALQ